MLLPVCSNCGAQARVACNCGVAYIPAGEFAAKAVAANPQKSDRAIAAEIGVGKDTVRRARQGGANAPTDKRTGKDGKSYPARKVPEKQPSEFVAKADDGDNGNDFEKLKAQLLELERRRYDDEVKMAAIVKRANLTPDEARNLIKFLEEFFDQHQVEQTYYDMAHKIVREDDDRKQFTKEAANPRRTLDHARKQEQRDDMEDDREEAKQQARQNGESWSDIKDEWESGWLAEHWQENWQELQFLRRFKAEWMRNHRQEFPASDFAPGKIAAEVAKAAASNGGAK